MAEEVSAYLLGNALAVLEADTQEKEIQGFVEAIEGSVSPVGCLPQAEAT